MKQDVTQVLSIGQNSLEARQNQELSRYINTAILNVKFESRFGETKEMEV